MGIALEKNTETTTIRLEGAIRVGCAAELKQALVEALEPGRKVRVALDGVTDLDVTAVQLVSAAWRAAQAAGVRLAIEGQLPDPLRAALADAGLADVLFTT